MHKPIVFLGTSTNLEIFIRVCTLRGMPVAGIVDSDFYGNAETKNGLPVIGSEDTFDFESTHDHSRAEWLAAWRRERSPLDTLPAIFEPLITTS